MKNVVFNKLKETIVVLSLQLMQALGVFSTGSVTADTHMDLDAPGSVVGR